MESRKIRKILVPGSEKGDLSHNDYKCPILLPISGESFRSLSLFE